MNDGKRIPCAPEVICSGAGETREPEAWDDPGQRSPDRAADVDLADLLERRTEAHASGMDAILVLAIRTAIARLRRLR
jgi:cytochrome P450